MKVFISYNYKDEKIANGLINALNNEGIETFIDREKISPGTNFIDRINKSVHEADAVLVLISKNYLYSKYTQQELLTWRLKDKIILEFGIIFIVIDEVQIPSFIQDYLFIDYKSRPLHETISILKQFIRPHTKSLIEDLRDVDTQKQQILEEQLNILCEEYKVGNLTLFCGAGVSIDAGIPGGSVFLRSLLINLLDNQTKKISDKTPSSKIAELYQDYFKHSSLIVAQYLKNSLGKDFFENVREALYADNPESSSLIEIMCELCRPQKERKSLNSIVTFNFDDLIENNLNKKSIKNHPIYREGQRFRPSEIPIYHVHGFLPRTGKLTKDHHVVLSEDAYHSQFIDPFSWSNLIQLNHLNNNTCLFVGLSLTDPNLRRLLDVSSRKNPSKKPNHYIVKKRYSKEKLEKYILNKQIKNASHNSKKLINLTEILEEKDANNLGLNVIWIENFDEIPSFLNNILSS